MLPGAVVPIAETTAGRRVGPLRRRRRPRRRGHDRLVGPVIRTPTAPRSALKPLQAQAMVDAGFAAEPDELAVAAASHSGESVHLEAVRRILANVGLDEHALGNTPALPLAPAVAAEVLRAGGGPSPLLQNCSGKHACDAGDVRRQRLGRRQLPRRRPPCRS